MKKGLVVSDLHFFSRRSHGEALFKGLGPQLEKVDLLVLNGDTFDFRWSTLASEAHSLAAAREWLEDWVGRFQGRRIHFVLGNHDCLTPFRIMIEELAEGSEVLWVHELHLTLGRSLFLHGDCANRCMSRERLAKYRDYWSRDQQRGAWGRAFYDVVDATRAGILFHRCYFPQTATVDRVAGYLDEVLPGWQDDIDDCYFGHTHRPFRDHAKGNVRFHNTGSGTRGMGFLPLEFTVE